MARVKRLSALFCSILLVISVLFCAPISVAAYSEDYPNTWKNTGNQIEDLIGVATTQVGYHGIEYVTGTKYGAWFGNTMAPWCGMFISWCASQAGIPSSIILHSARANAYKDSGVYHAIGTGYTPQRGDLALYNPNDGDGYYFPATDGEGKYTRSQHVAIVCEYNPSNDQMLIVHGNGQDDRVCLNWVPVHSGNRIQAFVTPNYTSGGSSTPQSDYINGTSVRLRSAPTTRGSEILATLDYPQTLTVLRTVTDEDGESWYEVSLTKNGRELTGYVFAVYVTVVAPPEPTDTVNGTGVRIRSVPDSSNRDSILGVLSDGQSVTVLDAAYDSDGSLWYRVRTLLNGSEVVGYVYGEYINLVHPLDPEPEPEDPSDFISTDGTVLYESPSDQSEALAALEENHPVSILDTVRRDDDQKWYHVALEYEGSRKIGYVPADSVTLVNPNAPPAQFRACLDAPAVGTSVSLDRQTQLRVVGWAFADIGTAVCYVRIDSETPISCEVASRPDVKEAFPEECPSEQVGFEISLPLTALKNGEHTLQILASSGITETILETRTFTVNDPLVPVLGDLSVDEIDAEGFTVSAMITDNFSVESAELTVRAESDAAEADRVLAMSVSEEESSRYTARVLTTDFTADKPLLTRLFATDNSGNRVCLAEFTLAPASYQPKEISFLDADGRALLEPGLKHFLKPYLIPSVLPEKDGYFCRGWSLQKEAQAPQYRPGDTYREEKPLVLYAVWVNENDLAPGDLNGDGAVDSLDLAALKRHCANLPVRISCKADINEDGRIDTQDLAILKRRLAGIS